MKKYILLALLLSYNISQAQEILDFRSTSINLEDTTEYKYLLIDTDSVWFIGKPQKDLLFLPSEIPSLGEYAIYTDTNQYYKNNVRASFQFKLLFYGGDIYQFYFYQKYDFEPNKDGGIIETSYNDGETWQNIIYDPQITDDLVHIDLYNEDDTIEAFDGQPGFTGLFSTGKKFGIAWRNDTIEGDTILIRFTFASDSVDAENEGWLLDDFSFGIAVEDPILDNEKETDFYIFPNPTSNWLNIKTSSQHIIRIEITSITGDLLLTKEGFDNETVDVSSFAPGLYFIRCFTEFNQLHITKFMKL